MNESKNEHEKRYDEHPVLDDSYQEETAAEIVDPDISEDKSDNDADVNNVYGWIAIALSVVSFFFIPILFAGAGVILGFVARNKDAPILGNTAIAIGIISVLVRLFIMPLI